MAAKHQLTTKEFLLPFVMISFLFFLWGIAHGMVDTLDKHFQQMLHLSKSQSSMILLSCNVDCWWCIVSAINGSSVRPLHHVNWILCTNTLVSVYPVLCFERLPREGT